MRQSTLARRYAGALFEQARTANAVDRIESDLGMVTYSVQSMPRLQETLTHPLIPADRKKAIIAQVFEKSIDSITLNFLYLLIDKRREDIIADTEQEYVVLANDFRGVVPAMATSAVPLTADEKTSLQAKLEVFTGRKVELHIDEDPELIGGLVVRIGDTVIDGSVRGYLAALKDKLLGRE